MKTASYATLFLAATLAIIIAAQGITAQTASAPAPPRPAPPQPPTPGEEAVPILGCYTRDQPATVLCRRTSNDAAGTLCPDGFCTEITDHTPDHACRIRHGPGVCASTFGCRTFLEAADIPCHAGGCQRGRCTGLSMLNETAAPSPDACGLLTADGCMGGTPEFLETKTVGCFSIGMVAEVPCFTFNCPDNKCSQYNDTTPGHECRLFTDRICQGIAEPTGARRMQGCFARDQSADQLCYVDGSCEEGRCTMVANARREDRCKLFVAEKCGMEDADVGFEDAAVGGWRRGPSAAWVAAVAVLYEMRREMQEILPNLWLGPYSCARELETLVSHGITHILGIMDQTERRLMRRTYPDRFVYHFIEVSDSPMQNLIPYFPEGKDFIGRALAAGGRVLVYCNNGLSRSPAFVVAYVMEVEKRDFEDAYAFVQQRRFCMNPNEGFKYQLKEYEPIFQARAQISDLNYTAEAILHQGQLKRQMLEEDSDAENVMDE
ncbi:hypothetical protein HDU96_002479 [Phlyctochytrium bullatum]|nr:hypothetical protein HDU96_002479 [Phlyctochytrium bullatum]